MNPFSNEWLRMLPLIAPPLLLSLTLHEYAHARVALAFGDPTALRAGRVTLNPLRHLDLIGTLMLLFSGIMGWAKPVPVNPYLLRPPRLGDIMVSLAGPLSNLALAVIVGCALRILSFVPGLDPDNPIVQTALMMLTYTLLANIGLCIFNLLPLFPLDGHHVLGQLLPPQMRDGYMLFQRKYGLFILLAIMIGPRILSRMSAQPVPNPIHWLFDTVVGFALPLFGLG